MATSAMLVVRSRLGVSLTPSAAQQHQRSPILKDCILLSRRPQILFLLAFVGSVLASFVPIYLSFGELADVRTDVQTINETAAVARGANAAAEALAGTLSHLAGLGLTSEHVRAPALSQIDRHIAEFEFSLHRLTETSARWIGTQERAELMRAAQVLDAGWGAARAQFEHPAAAAERRQALLQLVEETRKTRAVLHKILGQASSTADRHSKAVFEHVGMTAMLLLGAVAAGFIINSFGSVSVFRALQDASTANVALSAVENKLRKRTDRLSEAHRLGKLFDWHMMFDERAMRCAREAFHLLGYDPKVYPIPLATLRQAFVGDGFGRLLDANREVLRSRRPKSVDVKIRRADGSVGDFTLTFQALLEGGRPVGLFGTAQEITARKAAEERLEAIAYFDPLTSLPNRALFTRTIEETLTQAAEKGAETSLLLLDLDRFKEVNDALGHAAGDELLVRVGKLISVVVGGRHFVARLGGDEFAIIVSEQIGRRELEALARELITVLSGFVLLQRGEVSIGTSIGIVTAPKFGKTTNDLLRNADLSLYRAKEGGRGRFSFFTPDMDTAMRHRIALSTDLRHAVNKGLGLSTYFQPQLDLATGRVVGYEALLRWKHPTRGEVSPSEFVPIAETTGLICPLGNWVLRETAAQAKAWLDSGIPPREVSVNVSVAQIWHSDFVETVAQVLKETQLPPHLLCLELTESLMADHSEGRVRGALKALKGLGVTLALDDFGTHYSSLGYLAQLPFDKLKIDRVFVHGVADSRRSRELLKGIIALGRGLGMTVLAEGVETSEEVEILRALGCDQVQGHAFSRAIAAEAAARYAAACDLEPAYGIDTIVCETESMVKSLRAVRA